MLKLKLASFFYYVSVNITLMAKVPVVFVFAALSL